MHRDHEALIDHLVNGDARPAEMVARGHIETCRAMTLEKVVASLNDATALVPGGLGRAVDG